MVWQTRWKCTTLCLPKSWILWSGHAVLILLPWCYQSVISLCIISFHKLDITNLHSNYESLNSSILEESAGRTWTWQGKWIVASVSFTQAQSRSDPWDLKVDRAPVDEDRGRNYSLLHRKARFHASCESCVTRFLLSVFTRGPEQCRTMYEYFCLLPQNLQDIHCFLSFSCTSSMQQSRSCSIITFQRFCVDTGWTALLQDCCFVHNAAKSSMTVNVAFAWWKS